VSSHEDNLRREVLSVVAKLKYTRNFNRRDLVGRCKRRWLHITQPVEKAIDEEVGRELVHENKQIFVKIHLRRNGVLLKPSFDNSDFEYSVQPFRSTVSLTLKIETRTLLTLGLDFVIVSSTTNLGQRGDP